MVDVTLADSPAEYSKYSGWPELKESFMVGKVKAAYLLAPMVMDLVESGVNAKIVSLVVHAVVIQPCPGHRTCAPVEAVRAARGGRPVALSVHSPV